MQSAIGYVRVSTSKQGESGLGLESQQAAVESYARTNGLRLVTTYTEIETGKDNERPQLKAALVHAKRSNAKLVVSKLDRLSRNAAFLLTLLEAKAPVVCCDNPHANELTIGLLSVIAQHEAKMISDRTKAALQAAKARGTKLGSAREGHWQGKEQVRLAGAKKARQRSASVRAELARKAHEELAPIVLGLKAGGLSLSMIAETLNKDGWKTRRGKDWTPVYVCRFLKRCRATDDFSPAKSTESFRSDLSRLKMVQAG
jgi:DNA invertase Pin-like site-specific DNA recombinase